MMQVIKRNVTQQYKLPIEVSFCKLCTISNQRPRITFQNGVCSACQYNERKKRINWASREFELEALLSKHRKNDESFDVLVPCSGGKDGSFVAHQLKSKYGMKPLTVTWSPLEYTEHGRQNLNAFIKSGFSHILGTPNIQTVKLLTRLSLLHIGDPFQPFIYGQTNFPMKIAKMFNIGIIFYGENGEVEYGGDSKNENTPFREITDHDRHYFSGIPVEDWIKWGVKSRDLEEFSYKSTQSDFKIAFLGYFKKWDPQENFYYSTKNTGFLPNPERTEGTYSKYASLDDKFDGFHYYLAYIKFGLGRASSDSAHEIRDGKLTRDEGIDLVKKYDGEFPQRYFKEFLDFCEISEIQFEEIIESWRNENIWLKSNGQWKLRKPIWSD